MLSLEYWSSWLSFEFNPEMATPARTGGKPPYPPFTQESAQQKVKAAQDLWNTKLVIIFLVSAIHPNWQHTRDPAAVKNAYTETSIWRNRDTFLKGHDAIVDFLIKKWAKENGYRLRKELFAFQDNKVGSLETLAR